MRGYEDYYEASSHGRVRSKDRLIIKSNGTIIRRKGVVLTPTVNKNVGFLQVMLHRHMKHKLCYVHRLVCEAFINNPNDYDQVTHINGDKKDNRPVNLKWVGKNKRTKK